MMKEGLLRTSWESFPTFTAIFWISLAGGVVAVAVGLVFG